MYNTNIEAEIFNRPQRINAFNYGFGLGSVGCFETMLWVPKDNLTREANINSDANSAPWLLKLVVKSLSQFSYMMSSSAIQ